MKKYKFMLRFDDICPTMDWCQWNRAKEILDKYNLKPLLGVIPDCIDPKLQLNTAKADFWEYIRSLKKSGYAIAMHGYKHKYLTNKSGMAGVGNKSEFAGLPYDEQYKMLEYGKKIFEANGIAVDIFFAPSHSYDKSTLKALSDLGFKWLSDGKGLKAVKVNNIILLPCITGGVPKHFWLQYMTIVMHAQEWIITGKEKEYMQYKNFCEKYHDYIVDFSEFSRQPLGNYRFNRNVECMITFYHRKIKPVLAKIKKIIMK